MTRLLFVVVLSLALLACAREEPVGDPQVFAEDALSVMPPHGWRVKRERETLVFVGGSSDESSQAVIAIRSVPVAGWSEPRTAENLLPSVRTVLEALPDAKVTGPRDVEHPAYRAQAFDVVFTPRSKRGKRYRRRHVILEASGHLYHVLLTAPDSTLDKHLPAFESVVGSLREEV